MPKISKEEEKYNDILGRFTAHTSRISNENLAFYIGNKENITQEDIDINNTFLVHLNQCISRKNKYTSVGFIDRLQGKYHNRLETDENIINKNIKKLKDKIRKCSAISKYAEDENYKKLIDVFKNTKYIRLIDYINQNKGLIKKLKEIKSSDKTLNYKINILIDNIEKYNNDILARQKKARFDFDLIRNLQLVTEQLKTTEDELLNSLKTKEDEFNKVLKTKEDEVFNLQNDVSNLKQSYENALKYNERVSRDKSSQAAAIKSLKQDLGDKEKKLKQLCIDHDNNIRILCEEHEKDKSKLINEFDIKINQILSDKNRIIEKLNNEIESIKKMEKKTYGDKKTAEQLLYNLKKDFSEYKRKFNEVTEQQLRNHIKELHEYIDQRNSRIKLLKGDLTNLNANLREANMYRKQLQEIVYKNTGIEDEIKELEKQLQKSADKHTYEIIQLQKQLQKSTDKHTVEINELRRKLQQKLLKTEGRLTDEIKKLQKQLKESTDNHTYELRELRRKLQEKLQQKLLETEGRITDEIKKLYDEKISIMENDRKNLEKKLRETSNKLNLLIGENEVTKQEKEKLQKESSKLQSKLNELNRDYGVVLGEKNTLEKWLAEKRDDIVNQDKTITKLIKEKIENTAVLARTDEKLNAEIKAHEKTKHDFEISKELNAKYEKQLESINAMLNESKGKLKSKEEILNQRDTIINKLNENAISLNTELNILHKEISDVKKEIAKESHTILNDAELDARYELYKNGYGEIVMICDKINLYIINTLELIKKINSYNTEDASFNSKCDIGIYITLSAIISLNFNINEDFMCDILYTISEVHEKCNYKTINEKIQFLLGLLKIKIKSYKVYFVDVKQGIIDDKNISALEFTNDRKNDFTNLKTIYDNTLKCLTILENNQSENIINLQLEINNELFQINNNIDKINKELNNINQLKFKYIANKISSEYGWDINYDNINLSNNVITNKIKKVILDFYDNKNRLKLNLNSPLFTLNINDLKFYLNKMISKMIETETYPNVYSNVCKDLNNLFNSLNKITKSEKSLNNIKQCTKVCIGDDDKKLYNSEKEYNEKIKQLLRCLFNIMFYFDTQSTLNLPNNSDMYRLILDYNNLYKIIYNFEYILKIAEIIDKQFIEVITKVQNNNVSKKSSSGIVIDLGLQFDKHNTETADIPDDKLKSVIEKQNSPDKLKGKLVQATPPKASTSLNSLKTSDTIKSAQSNYMDSLLREVLGDELSKSFDNNLEQKIKSAILKISNEYRSDKATMISKISRKPDDEIKKIVTSDSLFIKHGKNFIKLF